jgi:pyridoxal phosphate enzyme (YggS family)
MTNTRMMNDELLTSSGIVPSFIRHSSFVIRTSSFAHMSVADNLHRVQERIARAAESAGRSANEITLVGVTKYVCPQQAAELVAAGCTHLGESRPQELWRKATELQRAGLLGTRRGEASPPPSSHSQHGDEDVPARSEIETVSTIHWHLIGHLQRNKVARTLPLVALIHSVDSERLIAAINEAREGEAPAEPRAPIKLLLEVNTSGETAKHGLAPNDVEPLLAAAPNYPHVAIRGLMTMAALDGGPTVAARNFATLRELRDRLKPRSPACVQLNELSMGMSGDFEIAIREGATIVRVGSALWENET